MSLPAKSTGEDDHFRLNKDHQSNNGKESASGWGNLGQGWDAERLLG